MKLMTFWQRGVISLEEKIERTLSPKMQAKWMTRVTNTWNGLDRFGLRSRESKGRQISEFGAVIAEDRPSKITASYLKRFPEFFKAGVHYVSRGSAMQDVAGASVPSSRHAPRRIDEILLRDPRNVLVWFGTNRKPK